MTRLAFGFDLALDQHLGRDARVVGAGLPERGLAEHPVVARERVHQRVLKGVAHMQAAGDVRRRQHDAVGVARGIVIGREIAALLPYGIPAGLDGMGVEGLVHVGHQALPFGPTLRACLSF